MHVCSVFCCIIVVGDVVVPVVGVVAAMGEPATVRPKVSLDVYLILFGERIVPESVYGSDYP